MKKLFATFVSLFIAVSFSSIAVAANHAAPLSYNITKQVVFSDEEPTPAPAPEPAPKPES